MLTYADVRGIRDRRNGVLRTVQASNCGVYACVIVRGGGGVGFVRCGCAGDGWSRVVNIAKNYKRKHNARARAGFVCMCTHTKQAQTQKGKEKHAHTQHAHTLTLTYTTQTTNFCFVL